MQEELADQSAIPVGIYRHYKGKDYRVLGTAKHSETESIHVIYQTCYGNQDFWVRPLDMFQENIDVEGKLIPRFALMEKFD